MGSLLDLAAADGDDWFSSTGQARCPITLRSGAEQRDCTVHFARGKPAFVEVGGERVEPARLDAVPPHARDGRVLWLDRDGIAFRFEEPDPLQRARPVGDESVVASPVSGLLRHLAITEGDAVRRGDIVAVVEAMPLVVKTRL